MYIVDLRSSLVLTYFMMTHPLPVASKFPINTLVVRQLPTNTQTHTHAHRGQKDKGFRLPLIMVTLPDPQGSGSFGYYTKA